MQANDFEPFRKMMALTAEQYGKPMSPDLIRFYFDGLSHLPIETVRSALAKHIRNTDTGQFMPKVADILRACDGRTEDAAYAALVLVQGAFSSVGAWQSVKFADPIINTVLRDMGGWIQICGRDAEEWAQFGSKDFMKRFRTYTERGLIDAPAYLPGQFALTNGSLVEDVPILIGTKPKEITDAR